MGGRSGLAVDVGEKVPFTLSSYATDQAAVDDYRRTTTIGHQHKFSDKAKSDLNSLYSKLTSPEDRDNLIRLLSSSNDTKDLEKVLADLNHIISMKPDQFSGMMSEFGRNGMQQRVVSDALKSFIDNDQGKKATCVAGSLLKGMMIGDQKSLFTQVLRDIVDNGRNDKLNVPLPADTLEAFPKSGYKNLSSYLFQAWFMNAASGGKYTVATDSVHRPQFKDVLGASSVNSGGLWSQEVRAGLELLYQSPVKQLTEFNSNQQKKEFGETVDKSLKAGLPIIASTKGLALEGYAAENHAVSILSRQRGDDGKIYLTIKDTREGFKLASSLTDFAPVSDKNNEYRVEESQFFKYLNFVNTPEGIGTRPVMFKDGSPITDPRSLIEIQRYLESGGTIPPQPGELVPLPEPTIFTNGQTSSRNRANGGANHSSAVQDEAYLYERDQRGARNRFVKARGITDSEPPVISAGVKKAIA